jgi:hypothetical protein
MENIEKEKQKNENTENSVKKVRGVPFKKGDDPRRNLNGKPKGTKNFTTLLEIAIKKLGLGKTLDDLEIKVLKKGIEMAMKGKYPFYKDFFDRIYGQPTKSIDLTGDLKIQKIQELEEKLKDILENEK